MTVSEKGMPASMSVQEPSAWVRANTFTKVMRSPCTPGGDFVHGDHLVSGDFDFFHLNPFERRRWKGAFADLGELLPEYQRRLRRMSADRPRPSRAAETGSGEEVAGTRGSKKLSSSN